MVLKIKRDIYSKKIQMDASTAVYNWLTEKLQLPKGKVSIAMKNFSTDLNDASLESDMPEGKDFGAMFNIGSEEAKMIPAMI